MRRLCRLLAAAALFSQFTGCTYLRNRVDDFNDIYSIGVGGTIIHETPYPAALGIYAEATEFLHAGAMLYGGYMLELDRRGASVTKVNKDVRLGLGPFHVWTIDEEYPLAGFFKSERASLWQQRMDSLLYLPILQEFELMERGKSYPGKRLQFHGEKLVRYPRGWQDWGYVGLDVALCEPFVLHAGIRAKVGLDLSQMMDFVVGILGADLYSDDATEAEYEGPASQVAD